MRYKVYTPSNHQIDFLPLKNGAFQRQAGPLLASFLFGGLFFRGLLMLLVLVRVFGSVRKKTHKKHPTLPELVF